MRLFSLILLVHVFTSITHAGELITHTLQSSRLDNLVGVRSEASFQVFLPDGYAESEQQLPVVYWFPGGNQKPTSNIFLGQLEEEFTSGRIPPAVVVFMDSLTDYRTSLFLTSEPFGDWEGFFTSDVVPFVEETYRTRKDSSGRGIMGFSLGGLTSLMLPVFAPDTFGAVGANDPSIAFISASVRERSEFPPGYMESDREGITLEEFFDLWPNSITEFTEAGAVTSAYGQLAAKLSPSTETVTLGRLPFTADGQWSEEPREDWRQFDLLDPRVVSQHAKSLQQLQSVSIVIPETAKDTASAWTAEMLRVFNEAGIRSHGIQLPGDHNDFQHERFTDLLAEVTHSLYDQSKVVLSTQTHVENFDNFGTDTSVPKPLPMGWSVLRESGERQHHIDSVENANQTSTVRIMNDGDMIDRHLSLHAEGESAMIEFSADVSRLQGNTMRVVFDATVDRLDSSPSSAVTTFDVNIEFDFADGSTRNFDFDGFRDDTPQFEIATLVPLLDAHSMRFRLVPKVASGISPLLFSVDDVKFDFLWSADLNGDLELSASDLDLLSEAALRAGPTEFDLNQDGIVDASDRDHWILQEFGTTFGDANLDRVVNFSDFLAIANGFGLSPGTWETGDFDGDGIVAFGDFLLFSDNFGFDATTFAAQAVPEPGFSFLQSCLVFLIAFWVRRRSR